MVPRNVGGALAKVQGRAKKSDICPEKLAIQQGEEMVLRVRRRFFAEQNQFCGTDRDDKDSDHYLCDVYVRWCPEPESNRHALTGGRF